MTHALMPTNTGYPFGSANSADSKSRAGATYAIYAASKKRKPNTASINKYSEAVSILHSDSRVSLEEVALKCGLNSRSLRSFVRKWHPELLKSRCHSSTATKYAEAISAMRNEPHICAAEIAARYGYCPDTFRSYLRRHAPELLHIDSSETGLTGPRLPRRGALRYQAPISWYALHGGTLKTVAERYGIPYNTLYAHVKRNRPDLLSLHARKKTRIQLSRNQ